MDDRIKTTQGAPHTHLPSKPAIEFPGNFNELALLNQSSGIMGIFSQ
jgi:hypothetical protein